MGSQGGADVVETKLTAAMQAAEKSQNLPQKWSFLLLSHDLYQRPLRCRNACM